MKKLKLVRYYNLSNDLLCSPIRRQGNRIKRAGWTDAYMERLLDLKIC